MDNAKEPWRREVEVGGEWSRPMLYFEAHKPPRLQPQARDECVLCLVIIPDEEPSEYAKVAGTCFNYFQELLRGRSRDVVGCVERYVCEEAAQAANLLVPPLTNIHHREDVKVLVVFSVDYVLVPSVFCSFADVV